MTEIINIFTKVADDYSKSVTANKKLKYVDAFLLYTLTTAVTQVNICILLGIGEHNYYTRKSKCTIVFKVTYVLMVGTFPFNSFLSSFFCQLALFTIGGQKSKRFNILLNTLS